MYDFELFFIKRLSLLKERKKRNHRVYLFSNFRYLTLKVFETMQIYIPTYLYYLYAKQQKKNKM